MRLQEGAHPVDGPGLQFRGVLPGKHRDLGIRAERSYVDGYLERVRRDVVRQDKHWRLARARKIARHAVHAVGPQAVEVVQVFLDGLHRHVGAPLAKLLGPDTLAYSPGSPADARPAGIARPQPRAVGRV